MEKLFLKVPTIKCEGCVQNIERFLKQREGVILIEGNPDSKEVTISYDREKIREEEIRGAILQMGYQIA